MTTQQAEANKIVNGVDVTRLVETIQAIQNQPELAGFKFRANNEWRDGSQNRTTIKDFYGTCQEISHTRPFVFDADEPPVLLGKDEGANPVEYLLTALSSCMTTSLAYHAAAQGIEIEGIESNYEGDLDAQGFLDLDPKVRNGFREIRAQFKVKSEADREKLAELIKKSPVFDVVTNPTPVKVTVITE
ncbi:MAG: OsmC family protein [Nitrospinaceae bacterium]